MMRTRTVFAVIIIVVLGLLGTVFYVAHIENGGEVPENVKAVFSEPVSGLDVDVPIQRKDETIKEALLRSIGKVNLKPKSDPVPEPVSEPMFFEKPNAEEEFFVEESVPEIEEQAVGTTSATTASAAEDVTPTTSPAMTGSTTVEYESN